MRVVIAPPVPALLPEYASLVDPVGELRAACLEAVAWLGESVRVVAEDDLGRRVGEWLLGSRDGRGTPSSGTVSKPHVLVMANGSARRSEKAPGHLDPRAAGFDEALGDLLARGDVAGLAHLDLALGRELLTAGLSGLAQLDGVIVEEASVDYADDPYGVMYWVVRWQCAS